MAKKKKAEEHVNHERWLVSYADFITLLFAFFVVMYAISEVDKNKLKKLSQSVQFAFSYKGTGGTMTQGKNADTFRPKVIGTAWPQGRRDSDVGPFENLRAVVQFLEHSVAKWFLQSERGSVVILDDRNGVVLRMPAERLFATGSATVRPDRMSFLEEFGRTVAEHDFSLEICCQIRVAPRGSTPDEHDVASRRNSALTRVVRDAAAEWRARLQTSIQVVELTPEEADKDAFSRSVFEFRLLP